MRHFAARHRFPLAACPGAYGEAGAWTEDTDKLRRTQALSSRTTIRRVHERMYITLARRAFKLMEVAPIAGCLAEVGLYKGDGLRIMSLLREAYLPVAPGLYGFDSVCG